MPHVIIECSKKELITEPSALLLAINQTLMASHEFKEKDIKSRIYVADASLVGITMEKHAFIAVTLRIMMGRDYETKQTLINNVLGSIKTYINHDMKQMTEITVQILEINPDSYRKSIA